MKDNKVKVIATKVNPTVAEAFEDMCEQHNTSVYATLQMCIDVLIRMMDSKHQLTDELKELFDAFEDESSWHEVMNIAMTDGDVEMEVGEATYYLQDKNGKKRGVRGVLVKKPFFGKAQYTMNQFTIIERVFCLILPGLYKRLRYHAVENGYNNVVHLLEAWEVAHREDLLQKDIEAEFSDNRRDQSGRKHGNVACSRTRAYTPDNNPYDNSNSDPD